MLNPLRPDLLHIMLLELFVVLSISLPQVNAESCVQHDSCTAEHIVTDALSTLQTGLSLKGGNQWPRSSLSARPPPGTLQCGPRYDPGDASDSKKLCEDTSHYGDTLLVIHFNYRPFVGVLPFFLTRYAQCFRNIAVVAPEPPPDCPQYPIVQCDDKGYMTQSCYAAAFVANPGYRSYFIINDDSPFIPKRFMSYDRDSWWNMNCPPTVYAGVIPPTPSGYTLTQPAAEQFQAQQLRGIPLMWPQWADPYGLNGLIEWWEVHATAEMKNLYIAHMGGADAPQPCFQELMHIPEVMVPFYVELAKQMPFEELELFHAMAHHLWVAAGGQEEKIAPGALVWDWNYTSPLRGTGQMFEFYPGAAMVHPIKLSDPTSWPKVDDWLFERSLSSVPYP